MTTVSFDNNKLNLKSGTSSINLLKPFNSKIIKKQNAITVWMLQWQIFNKCFYSHATIKQIHNRIFIVVVPTCVHAATNN